MPVVIITPVNAERDSRAQAFDALGWRGQGHRFGRLEAISCRDGSLLLARGGLGKVQFAVHIQHVLDQSPDKETGCKERIMKNAKLTPNFGSAYNRSSVGLIYDEANLSTT